MSTKSKYFILIVMPLVLTGCLGTQHLKENQKRLIQQSVKAPAHIDEDALRELYAQRPNRRFLGLPIYHLVAMYYWGERNYDREKYVRKKEKFERKFDAKIAKTKSIRKRNNLTFKKQKKVARMESFIANGNQRMQWGEKVAVFDSGLVEITVNRFKNYLASEGYLQNTVTTRTNTIGKFITLTYNVETTKPYIIDTIFYRIADSAVYKLVKESAAESFVKVNQRFRADDIDKEAERIDLMLKDNGYYDFSRQYIDFPTDTSMLGDRRVAVMVQILDPAKRDNHKVFTIDSVRFLTDAGVLRPGRTRQKKDFRDIQFSYFENYYSLKILSQRVFLKSESLYNRTKTFETQRQLANLDAFKFVNVIYDTSGGKFIANIFTSPVDRYEWSKEAGVNVTQGFPGPFFNTNFKKRNIFRGLENFELNGRAGIEGVASAANSENIYKSIEAGVNASLIFPQFIWPLRDATQIRLAKYNPKTRLSLGYTFTDRPEYNRKAATLSNTYTWQNQRTTDYTLSLVNVSLINSKKSYAFDTLLQSLESQGNYNLVNSFRPSFVSSMIFGITWNHNYGSVDKNSVFIRGQLESGGTSLNVIDPKIITNQNLQYFKYLRLSVDFRRNRILNKFATLAYRINTGVAYDYSGNNTLPYEKFYFSGGSRSVRAWSPRRLGLGSAPRELTDTTQAIDDGRYTYQFEKPGEILIEGSIELRSKLVGFIDGAVFIDAGNVWSFKQRAPKNLDGTYQGNTQFRANSFLKEFGIGTGFGLRFDFTFLILCFDVGMKVYDPARAPDDRFVLDRVRFFKPYATEVPNSRPKEFTNYKEPVVYNIGIGYPF